MANPAMQKLTLQLHPHTGLRVLPPSAAVLAFSHAGWRRATFLAVFFETRAVPL